MEVVLLPVVAVSFSLALAAERPGWRDPDQDGSVAGKTPPSEFSKDKNLLWKVEMPGRGCSTPIVVDGKIIVTTSIGGKDGVIAYDLEGRKVYRKVFGELKPGRGQLGLGAVLVFFNWR